MKRSALSLPGRLAALAMLGAVCLIGSPVPASDSDKSDEPGGTKADTAATGLETATFGAGCFWCVEAVMEQLAGVVSVESGYMGGEIENPTHEQVSRGNTGHIEVVRVRYDPVEINYDDLLDIFWQAHDPTSWDRQGHDRGPQYRSAIFTHGMEQRAAAEASKKALDDSGKYSYPLVTEIREATTFWRAEEEHQGFYRRNPDFGYCRIVISPKLRQLGLEEAP